MCKSLRVKNNRSLSKKEALGGWKANLNSSYQMCPCHSPQFNNLTNCGSSCCMLHHSTPRLLRTQSLPSQRHCESRIQGWLSIGYLSPLRSKPPGVCLVEGCFRVSQVELGGIRFLMGCCTEGPGFSPAAWLGLALSPLSGGTVHSMVIAFFPHSNSASKNV